MLLFRILLETLEFLEFLAAPPVLWTWLGLSFYFLLSI